MLQTYEAGIFETCYDFGRERGRDVRMRRCGGSFIVQRRMVAVRHCLSNQRLPVSKISAGVVMAGEKTASEV
jgi:hypothetical protein